MITLEDIKNRYGENSKPYLCSKQIVENIMNSESGYTEFEELLKYV